MHRELTNIDYRELMIRPLGIYVPMYVVCTDYSIQFLRTTIKVIADVSCGNNPIQPKV